MKKFFAEFREFAVRGNAVQLAVGMMIGAAFGQIVTSLTEDLLSPLIGVFIGEDFRELSATLFGATFGYGAFLTAIVNFLILTFILFLLARGFNRVSAITRRGQDEEEETEPPKCPYCMTEVDEAATRCPACTSVIALEFED